jgi:hypothetical protein
LRYNSGMDQPVKITFTDEPAYRMVVRYTLNGETHFAGVGDKIPPGSVLSRPMIDLRPWWPESRRTPTA